MKASGILFLLFIVINASAQTTYPSGVTGCVARWDFNSIDGVIDSLPDVSGNGHTGAVTSLTAANGFRNVPGTAMTFDGTASYALVPNNSQLTLQQFTIIALVKFNHFNSNLCNGNQIICKGYPYWLSGQYGIGVDCNNYTGSCSIFDPSHEQMDFEVDASVIPSEPLGNYIQANKWYFLALTFDSSTIKTYQVIMDTAVYDTSMSPLLTYPGYSHPVDSDAMDISIGKHLNPSYPYFFAGAMDEIAIFNRALSPTEIESVYTYLWGAPGTDVPSFVYGAGQNLSVCENATISIDSLLSVNDTSAGHAETWSLAAPPVHGMAAVAYATTSTGSTLIPSGLTYTPVTGYSGTDAFEVNISNGISTNHTTITVTVDPFPNAGTISGADTVCPGATLPLSESVAGGIWASSDGATAIIDGSGNVTGMSPGNDTIVYVVMNACGIVSTIFPFTVNSYTDCPAGVPVISNNNGIRIYPNPNAGSFSITVVSNVEKETKLTITNVLGEKIKELTLISNIPTNVTLDEAPGIYFLNASSEHMNSVSKIVIAK